jgi:hypothetical protein
VPTGRQARYALVSKTPSAAGITLNELTGALTFDSTVTSASYTVVVSLSDNTVPSYVTQVAPYGVLSLATVTNGKPKWIDAVDPLYDSTSLNGGSDAGVRSVRNIVVESGGCADPARRCFYAHGGGHQDGWYNGILKFDLSGTTAPTGWTVATGSESPIAQVPYVDGVIETGPAAFSPYYDGKAGSTHSYESMVHDTVSNRMFRFFGSHWSVGFASGRTGVGCWMFDFTTGTWTALSSPFGANVVHSTTIPSAAHRKCLLMNDTRTAFFNMATASWGATATLSGHTFTTRMTSAFDTQRNRGIRIGKGLLKMFTVNFDAETTSGWSNFTVSGDTEIFGSTIEAVGTFYDPTLDRFWFFGGRDNSGGTANPAGALAINKLYWINADDLTDGAATVFSQTLAQAIPRLTSGAGYFMGFYKRFCFIDEWRALAVATTYDQNVHLIRLPSA